MDVLVGPLIERNGGYSYDTFTLDEGLRSSFRYPRLDAARYDRRALIAEARQAAHYKVRTCETLSEFNEAIEMVRSGAGPLAGC